MKVVWFGHVVNGVAHSFPLRYIEWMMGFGILFWGLKLLDPQDSFQTATGIWDGLAYWQPDYVWGIVMSAVGIARLAALTVNGTFRGTVYARYSPLVRGGTAFLCCLMWMAVSLSAFSAHSQHSIIYPVLFILEALTAYYVAGESGDTLREHRHERERRTQPD